LVDTEHGLVLMARGARNQKGPQRAFLNAVEAILAVHDRLPVNLMITVDGEEEIGSVHFSQVIDIYADRLKGSVGVLYPWTSQNAEGKIQIILGSKGLLYFELQATGNEVLGGPQNQAIHSSFRALVDSPVNHLVQALASLTSVDGNTILVENYYDGLLPPTLDEQRLLNGMVDGWPEEELKKSLAVYHWIDGQTGMTALLDYLYMPTMNVNGIWGGYTGTGSKTILPHQATAKIDSRLPPGLRPDRALALIRAHLDKHGFEDIGIHQLSGYPAASTPVTAPIIQAGLRVLNKYADPPLVMPRSGGSAPFDQFTDRLGLPVALIGLGFGDQIHAPNEFFVITPPQGSPVAGLAEIEKAYVDLLYAISGQ
jgi:acetylornithine deacetylase/succinyl-diaminopimelate desuccinylase-like protein